MQYIDKVNNEVNFKEGKGTIEKYLSLIYFNGKVSNKDLARELILPIPVVTAIKKEFIKLGVLEQNNGIRMTTFGEDYFLNECGYKGIEEETYIKLMNDKDYRAKIIDELSHEYNSIYENRPEVDVTIDQAKATVETSFSRAILCLLNKSLIGKNILCIGDDDLISIAIALLLKRLFPDNKELSTNIVVFDVDDRYIEYLSKLTDTYNLPIECVKINLNNPIPQSHIDTFDCFFTDPPYTNEGMSLFLSRGISALKKEKGLKVFLSYGQKPLNETLLLQETILSAGLIITDIYRSFNKYEGAGILGNVSQMMILETTDKVMELIPYDKVFDKSIYTREQKEPNSIYECKNCKKIIYLGKEEKYKTIEELKKGGCPFCEGYIFELQKKRER